MTELYNIEEFDKVFNHEGSFEFSEDLPTDGLHRFRYKNNTIDVLFHNFSKNIMEYKKAVVCFSGAVTNREGKVGPFFSGRGISNDLGFPLIAIADPVLSKCNINISWYAGSKIEKDLQYRISHLLVRLFKILSLNEIILIGGSGGGFASLIQASLIKNVKCKVFIWNPQTSITKYNMKFVRNYVFKAFFSQVENVTKKNELTECYVQDLFNNENIKHNINVSDLLGGGHQILYLQNMSDSHTEKHLLPFMNLAKNKWNRFSLNSFIHSDSNVGTYIGNWGDRHVPPPKEVIYFVIKSLLANKSTTHIFEGIDVILDSLKYPLEFVNLSIDNDFWDADISVEDDLCFIDVRLNEKSKGVICEYAYYLLYENKKVDSIYYSSEKTHSFKIGDYELSKLAVQVFIKMKDGNKIITTYSIKD